MTADTIWLIVGLGLLLLELVTQTFVFGSMGGASLAVSALLRINWFPLAGNVLGQVMVWSVFSLLLSYLSRLLVPRSTDTRNRNLPRYATTTEAILPHQEGRVTFEGSEWNAVCRYPEVAIPAGMRVRAIGKRGNTLIVLPPERDDNSDFEAI